MEKCRFEFALEYKPKKKGHQNRKVVSIKGKMIKS